MCFIMGSTKEVKVHGQGPLVRQDECLSSAYQPTHVARDGKTDRWQNETRVPAEIQA